MIHHQVRVKLGIPHPEGAAFFGLDRGYTPAELKSAYRAILLETRAHPDLGGSAGEFRAIQQAYERAQCPAR